jgi:hypothetical protein
MELISTLPGISKADLERFNRCRIFLGVTFLSEISTADGRSLSREAWKGTRPRFSALLWPYQPNPGPLSWRVWRHLLAKCFLFTVPTRTTPKTADLSLDSPLGNWNHDSHWYHCNFNFFHSPSTGRIYHYDGTRYHVHARLRRSRHQSQVYSATPSPQTRVLPSDSVPVEDLAGSDTILAFRGTDIRIQPTPPRPTVIDPPTFACYLSTLPHWEQKLLSAVDLSDIDGLLAQLQADNNLYIVSDGGAHAELGSFGALVANAEAIFVSLAGHTEGVEPGLYRAESYGCLAILRLLYHISTYYSIPPPAYRHTFYCDYLSLITRLQRTSGPRSPFPRHVLRSDMDLEMQIKDTLRLLGIQLTFTHVKGHQDSTTPHDPLPRQAILNIECDRLASMALKTATPTPTVQHFPASKITVTIDSITINRKLPRSICRLAGKARQRASFRRRYQWTAAQFDQIDWPQYRSASAQYSLTKCFFVIKWLNDLLPFQARMQRTTPTSFIAPPRLPKTCLAH